MSVNAHHKHARANLKIGVITASDTRTEDNDESGRLVREMVESAGHQVIRFEIVADTLRLLVDAIRRQLSAADAVIITGGTGIAPRDSTIEAARDLFDKELEGFGEIFRMLSYEEIGPAAFLSRATAGVSGGKLVVALPGSPAACRLALEKLLLPELGHIAYLLGQ